MSNVFPRYCKVSQALAVQGDGVYIIDRTGKFYLETSGGNARNPHSKEFPSQIPQVPIK